MCFWSPAVLSATTPRTPPWANLVPWTMRRHSEVAGHRRCLGERRAVLPHPALQKPSSLRNRSGLACLKEPNHPRGSGLRSAIIRSTLSQGLRIVLCLTLSLKDFRLSSHEPTARLKPVARESNPWSGRSLSPTRVSSGCRSTAGLSAPFQTSRIRRKLRCVHAAARRSVLRRECNLRAITRRRVNFRPSAIQSSGPAVPCPGTPGPRCALISRNDHTRTRSVRIAVDAGQSIVPAAETTTP